MIFVCFWYFWKKWRKTKMKAKSSRNILCIGFILIMSVLGLLFLFHIQQSDSGLSVMTTYGKTASSGNGATASTFLTRSPNQQFTAIGQDLNCRQQDLSTLLQASASDNNHKFAYVWYVASIHYFCSALTALQLVKDMRSQDPFLSVDYVVLIVRSELPGKENELLIDQWINEGGIIRETESLKHLLSGGYYQSTYQKFQAFLLEEYQRIILMDADGMPLKNLDHLFLLPFPSGVSLAAPQAYWFPNYGVGENEPDFCPEIIFTQISSILLVIEPNQSLFDRVSQHFGEWRPDTMRQNYDMDILNIEFGCHDEILVLPKIYGTLDSEFSWTEELSTNLNQCQQFSEVYYMHFTMKGKPWSHGILQGAHIYLGGFDFDVASMFIQWFHIAHQMCPNIIYDLSLN